MPVELSRNSSGSARVTVKSAAGEWIQRVKLVGVLSMNSP